jgi:3'-phosphoadenosine 5'-phosphosulfate sulfotransferase (PAPS reductase)/FAD synthetase
MEYVFCDTGEELPETYDYVERIEAVLGKPVIRLNPDRPFRHYLDVYSGVLPDPRTRWCTRMLKIRPFERFIGDAPVTSYVGIRYDERDRTGYISSRPNIRPRYPFIEDRVVKDDVLRLLEDEGVGLPSYYSWRSRSGCYFCFFQQLVEWVGLREHHPLLFAKAMELEKDDAATGKRFTWNERESLAELMRPDRVDQIRAEAASRTARTKGRAPTLLEAFSEDDDIEKPCLICYL